MPDTAYRTRLPHTYDVEVRVKRWAIRKPFTRSMVRMDIVLVSCWVFCSIIDILRIVIENYQRGWWLLGLHLFCVIGWSLNLRFKVERRTEIETKQVTE